MLNMKFLIKVTQPAPIRSGQKANNNMDKRFDLLYSQIDWNMQKRKPYVIGDPCDPDKLLYLVERDYLVTMRAALRTGDTLVVVARPGDEPKAKEDSK